MRDHPLTFQLEYIFWIYMLYKLFLMLQEFDNYYFQHNDIVLEHFLLLIDEKNPLEMISRKDFFFEYFLLYKLHMWQHQNEYLMQMHHKQDMVIFYINLLFLVQLILQWFSEIIKEESKYNTMRFHSNRNTFLKSTILTLCSWTFCYWTR